MFDLDKEDLMKEGVINTGVMQFVGFFLKVSCGGTKIVISPWFNMVLIECLNKLSSSNSYKIGTAVSLHFTVKDNLVLPFILYYS